jgi:hypothetical protein
MELARPNSSIQNDYVMCVNFSDRCGDVFVKGL